MSDPIKRMRDLATEARGWFSTIYRAVPHYPHLGSMGGGSCREAELQDAFRREHGKYAEMIRVVWAGTSDGLRAIDNLLRELEPRVDTTDYAGIITMVAEEQKAASDAYDRGLEDGREEAALWKRQHDDLHREACRLTSAIATMDAQAKRRCGRWSRIIQRLRYDRYRALLHAEQREQARAAAVHQAQAWAQEAKTQKATVQECYDAIGHTGQDWDGATPVREAIAMLRKHDEPHDPAYVCYWHQELGRRYAEFDGRMRADADVIATAEARGRAEGEAERERLREALSNIRAFVGIYTKPGSVQRLQIEDIVDAALSTKAAAEGPTE